jgi:hypothetical protein
MLRSGRLSGRTASPLKKNGTLVCPSWPYPPRLTPPGPSSTPDSTALVFLASVRASWPLSSILGSSGTRFTIGLAGTTSHWLDREVHRQRRPSSTPAERPPISPTAVDRRHPPACALIFPASAALRGCCPPSLVAPALGLLPAWSTRPPISHRSPSSTAG